MANISINLLPIEFTQEEVKRAKFFKIQTIGVGVILFMTFLTSLTVALRILQSQNIRQVQAQVSTQEDKVESLKGTQVSLLLLQNRLKVINKYSGVSSKQGEIYNLIISLLPLSVSVTNISIDQEGGVSLVALSPDILSLDALISGLTDQESNKGQVGQVSIESLNRSRDGVYRVNLKINLK